QHRPRPEAPAGGVQQLPDVGLHRRAVRVHVQVFGLVVVAGDVDIGDAFARQRRQVIQRVVAVVDGVDVDVVDVQQQVAVGLRQYRIDEIDLRHRLVGRGVVADVLDGDAPAQRVLDLTDAAGDMAHRLLGEGDGHQV